MKVLLIYAHPEPRSLNGALKNFAIRHLQQAGHEVQVSDNKQLQPAGIFDWSQLHPQGLHLHTSVPSPEVTAPFCLVPSPEFSQAPWYSLPDHLCRFGVRFDVT
ncbi:hypothetical protein AI2636V1_0440 [Klebsiella pneumoniae]|nr:hypothetical protein AI2636V1_0440 [Klebsiella pneumoniae]